MKILSIFLLLIGLVAPAAAAEGSATDAIRTANTRVRELLSEKVTPGTDAERKNATRVTSELRDLFDIGDLAKRALVDHWATMTPAQRSGLVETLRDVVERNYVSQLRSNLAYEIVYQGEEPRGEDVVVKTIIKAERGGRPVEIPVDYVLHHEAAGWRTYDVVTDEVSLVTNYRSQFNRIIGKDGVDGLIRRMKQRLEKHEE
jgi:phospholipid transport system substrate-binding protein